MTSDLDLLRQFARENSQDAFAEIVRRHLNLVYSAALRQVRSPQLAEEIAQSVFANLAHDAGRLKPDTVLTAWLYAVARRTAIDVIRKESRRQLREQIAAEMQNMNATANDWTQIAPLLDDAMAALDETDRSAILLRYFENKNLREVGEALGASEDAAQKRVSRAVEKLREFFSKQKITIGASGLAVLISANAVQSAPVGLVAAISTAAVLTGTATSVSTVISTTKVIAMTTLQKTIIGAALTAAVGTGVFEAHQASQMREQVQTLQQQQAPMAEQMRRLQTSFADATNRLAGLLAENTRLKSNADQTELLKLRGEVGMMRQENKIASEKSALNRITADPAARAALRNQEKAGLRRIYGDFARNLNLTSQQTEQFNDLLADHAMDNIALITQALHDGKSRAEVDQIFSAAETALQGQVRALLGDDALARYKDYTQNLVNTLATAEFSSYLTGDAATQQAKQAQLQQLFQQTTTAALKNSGLPEDYQVVPILNPGNIASEEEASQSLNLLDGIYASVATNSSSFLTPDEVASFQTFRTNALNHIRLRLTGDRKMMSPIAQ